MPALLGVLLIGNLLPHSAPGQSPGPQYPQVAFSKPAPGQISETTIRYDGIDRRVIYRVPGNFKPAAKHPLLFVLHGFNSSIGAVVGNYARACIQGRCRWHHPGLSRFDREPFERHPGLECAMACRNTAAGHRPSR